MKITYQTTDLKQKEINIDNAVNVKINGIQIKEEGGDAIRLSVNEKIQVLPNASNSVTIKEI